MTDLDSAKAIVKTLKRLFDPEISKKTLLAGFSRSGIRNGVPDPSHQINNPAIFEPGKQFRSQSLLPITPKYLKELFTLQNMINSHRSPIMGITYDQVDTAKTALEVLALQGGVGARDGSRISFLFQLARSQDEKGELLADAVYRGRVGINAEQRARQILELNNKFGYDDDGSLDSDSDDSEESADTIMFAEMPSFGSGTRCDTTYGAPLYGAAAKAQVKAAHERRIEKEKLGIEK